MNKRIKRPATMTYEGHSDWLRVLAASDRARQLIPFIEGRRKSLARAEAMLARNLADVAAYCEAHPGDCEEGPMP